MMVVLGHNHVLAPSESPLFSYLYSFHLMCFFILPWFYFRKCKSCDQSYIYSILRRNYIPYSIFFLICLALFIMKERTFNINWIQTAKGYLIGSPLNLRLSIGFIFLWFLPAFASFSILKVICNTSTTLKCVLLTASFCAILLPWDIQEWLKNNLPFGLFFAIKFLCLGWITMKCLNYVPFAQYIGGIAFVILSVLYFIDVKNGLIIEFLPIIAFLTILSLRRVSCNIVLRSIGKYSLCIYLVHMFISTFLDKVLPPTIFYGIMAYCITLISSYLISLFIYHTKLHKIIFPR